MSEFEENARKLRELHTKIHATFANRDNGTNELIEWEKACKDFHEQYNDLAFPGGLDKQQMQLDKLEPHAIEMAIQFLEADPWFFRSGYLKTVFTRRLKRASLTEDQILRLNIVILSMVKCEGRRELRSFCRLARAIQTPKLLSDIHNLAESPDEGISRRANFMLDIINS